jgi:hypothetical protein
MFRLVQNNMLDVADAVNSYYAHLCRVHQLLPNSQNWKFPIAQLNLVLLCMKFRITLGVVYYLFMCIFPIPYGYFPCQNECAHQLLLINSYFIFYIVICLTFIFMGILQLRSSTLTKTEASSKRATKEEVLWSLYYCV